MKNVEKGTIEYEINTLKNAKDGAKPRLLLHACCGPCSTSVLEYLTPFFDVTVFYYNPNIMPKDEFILRENALKTVVSHFDGVKLVTPAQDEKEYLDFIKGREADEEGGARCSLCFQLRLAKTAEYFAAHAQEFDFFATTLTVSPHKNVPLINAIGKKVAEKFGANYLSSDFKKRDGYLRSIRLCKQWEIYRQTYCGCRLQGFVHNDVTPD